MNSGMSPGTLSDKSKANTQMIRPTIIQDDHDARAYLLRAGLLPALEAPQGRRTPWLRSCLAESGGARVLGIRVGGYRHPEDNGWMVVLVPIAECSTGEWAATAQMILAGITKPGTARAEVVDLRGGQN